MGKAVFDITVSLDGYVTGPDDDRERPLGEGGELLHDWIFSRGTAAETTVLDELYGQTGAVIAGRRTYDFSAGPGRWGDGGPLGRIPVFVLTHDVPEKAAGTGDVFTFVTDGIESALAQAKEVAGDRNVYVMGGADIAQQYIEAGLLDEIQLHVVPVLLGAGRRLFEHIGTEHVELESTRVLHSPGAVHLRYRIVK